MPAARATPLAIPARRRKPGPHGSGGPPTTGAGVLPGTQGMHRLLKRNDWLRAGLRVRTHLVQPRDKSAPSIVSWRDPRIHWWTGGGRTLLGAVET